MNIAIIDADLIGRKKHRFPNLACMKLSGYYKELGNNIELKTNYENLDIYDKVFISKVFTDTPVKDEILNLPNVEYGGTGFYYDKAPKLECQIEHHMPDYHLYDEWVKCSISSKIEAVEKKKTRELSKKEIQQIENDFTYYKDYSIGFVTRGCFRQCSFCVNRNYKKVEIHSPLDEFVDPSRPKICLLDDNFLGCPEWKTLLLELQSTGKPFQFKQGLDERILNDEKCELLFSSKYDGDYIFAFDNIEDAPLIERKLQLIRKYTDKVPKFYVFCGFDRNDKWNLDFWKQDIVDVFKRIQILMRYNCLPYIMRFNRHEESPFKGTYTNLASWCNQPNFFKKKSYREWCISDNLRKGGESATDRYMKYYEQICPDIAKKYYDIKWVDLCTKNSKKTA